MASVHNLKVLEKSEMKATSPAGAVKPMLASVHTLLAVP
jgi:hypothetical protein